MLSCSGSLSRSIGSWFAETSRPLGSGSRGLQEGRIVGSGFPSRCRMCHLTRPVVLRVRGPLARLAPLSSRPMSPFVVPVPGSCRGHRGVAPRGEACCSGPCLGRRTLCGRGSVYADTAWRLWFGSWFGRCSPCAVMGSGPVPGRWCCAVVCGCSSCFGYTLCGPGSGYAGVLRYLRFGLWRSSRYVVMRLGLVPVPVGVVSLPPLSSPPPGARLCWKCRGHDFCGLGSLAPGFRCVLRGWGLGVVCLVCAPGLSARRDNWGRPGVVSPLGLLLMACSALRVPSGCRRPGAPAPSCPVFVLRVWSFLRAMYVGVEATPVRAEAGSDPRGHLWVTWGVSLCACKPPLADIILSHPPGLTRCDSVIGLAIPAMSGHIQYRGAAS